MKKLLTILLVLISFSSFAQFEAGEYINSDTVKIDGVPLLLNTFKKDSLGGAGNIFYSTGASSQPASGSVNQVIGGNSLTANYVPKWDGSKFANTGLYYDDGRFGFNGIPYDFFSTSFFGYTRIQDGDLWLKQGINSGENYALKVGPEAFGLRTGIIKWSFQTDGLVIDTWGSSHETRIGGSNIILAMTESGTPFGSVGVAKIDPTEKLDINGNIIADTIKARKQFISLLPTGTPPLVVASSTKVDSLNVGLFDGKKASDFQLKSDTLTFDATLSDLADSSAAIRELANTKAVVSGTDNYIMKKTGANTLGNSVLIEKNGKIGIDFREPIAKLHVVESTFLDSTQGAYQIITSEQGVTSNRFRNNKWILRGSDGKDWKSASWHDGISVDNTFNIPRNNTRTWWERNPNGNIQSWGSEGTTYFTLNGANAGFGTTTPAARIHSQSTTTQARLGYDANKYTDLSTGSTGNLTIDPTGDTVNVVGAVNSIGGFFKNGVEITGGGGMVYPPAGLAKSNGSAWVASITDNSIKWDSTYNKIVTAVAITGSTVKTILLNRKDGTQLSGSFTDLGADWRTDSFGANYGGGTGNIGVGTISKSDCRISGGNLLGYNIVGVRGESSLNAGVLGRSTGYTGVYGTSTDSYGIYGESANNYGGWFEGIGVNIRTGNLDVNSQTRITSGGFFQPVSSTDAAAPNNSIYYSTTQSKLVYKNASGTVNVLY